MNKGVALDLQISQVKLSQLVTNAIDEALQDNNIEVSGFKVKLTRLGNSVILPKDKAILMSLPFKLDLIKENGLFSIEGHGSLELDFMVLLDVNKHLKAHFKSEILNVRWIESPTLDLGMLNIPLERLIKLVLNHYESIITAKIDHQLNTFGDLNQHITTGLQKVDELWSSIDNKGLAQNLDIVGIALQPFIENEGQIHIKGVLDLNIEVAPQGTSFDSRQRQFVWADSIYDEKQQSVKAKVPYDVLEDVIADQLKNIDVAGKNISVERLKINKVGDLLDVQAEITSPISGYIHLSAVPEVHGTDHVYMDLKNPKISIKPANLIYRLTAPIIENVVKTKMEKMFPMSLDDVMQKLQDTILEKTPDTIPGGSLDLEMDKITLNTLDFQHTAIVADLSIHQPMIKIKMND